MDEIAFLEQLVSIPSVSGEEDAVAEYMVGQMESLGFHAHRDEAGNAVGVLGDPEAEREIALIGHMDTVPGLIPVHRRGDCLYGRGAVDAKGPLATFVLAAARAAPQLNRARVVVIGTVGEEVHSRGGHYLARHMEPPDCVIIGEPSAWDSITLGYKGILTVDYRLTQSGGHSAGSRPGPAQDAVAFWNRLMTYAEACNAGQEGRFTTLDPALREFRTFSDGLDDGVDMNVVLRLPPGADVSDLKHRMRGWCNGANLSFPYHDPAYRSEKNSPLVRAMLRAIRAQGVRPRFKLKTGSSDMNVVGPAWGCPIVAYGPGDSSLDHTPDEHIDVREFRRAVKTLARALEILGE